MRTTGEAITFLMREAGIAEPYIAWALENTDIRDYLTDTLWEYIRTTTPEALLTEGTSEREKTRR